MPVHGAGDREKRLKNKIFQSRELCLRALDTNSACAKSVRENERTIWKQDWRFYLECVVR